MLENSRISSTDFIEEVLRLEEVGAEGAVDEEALLPTDEAVWNGKIKVDIDVTVVVAAVVQGVAVLSDVVVAVVAFQTIGFVDTFVVGRVVFVVVDVAVDVAVVTGLLQVAVEARMHLVQ